MVISSRVSIVLQPESYKAMLRPLIANPLMLLALHGDDDDDEDEEDDDKNDDEDEDKNDDDHEDDDNHDDEDDGEMHYYKLGDGAGSLLGKLAC